MENNECTYNETGCGSCYNQTKCKGGIIMTKGNLFSASVRCPKCGKAMHMRVSDNKDYAYQCLDCDEDFYSFECPDTVSDYGDPRGDDIKDLYEITLHKQSTKWYRNHKDILNKICDKYDVDFMGCDNGGTSSEDEEVFVDFGWEKAPDADIIQKFTDDIINLL